MSLGSLQHPHCIALNATSAAKRASSRARRGSTGGMRTSSSAGMSVRCHAVNGWFPVSWACSKMLMASPGGLLTPCGWSAGNWCVTPARVGADMCRTSDVNCGGSSGPALTAKRRHSPASSLANWYRWCCNSPRITWLTPVPEWVCTPYALDSPTGSASGCQICRRRDQVCPPVSRWAKGMAKTPNGCQWKWLSRTGKARTRTTSARWATCSLSVRWCKGSTAGAWRARPKIVLPAVGGLGSDDRRRLIFVGQVKSSGWITGYGRADSAG